jgi:hypothetical protein
MNERRNFITSMVAAIPVSVVASQAAEAADSNVNDVVGAWTTIHTSPVGPFRELLVFSAGGGVTETNTLLHTNSRLALFAQFGLPLPAAVNASDGLGNWRRLGPGLVEVVFRKLLFDEQGTHLGDFRVHGRVGLARGRFQAEWDSIRIETLSSGAFEVGPASSEGVRIE